MLPHFFTIIIRVDLVNFFESFSQKPLFSTPKISLENDKIVSTVFEVLIHYTHTSVTK